MLDVAGDRRSIVKNIRFSQKEWDVVSQKMMECEISEFSEYARLACLQLDPIIFDIETFSSLIEIKRDLKDFLLKIGEGELSGKDWDNAKECFSALNNFLERIFSPSIKIISRTEFLSLCHHVHVQVVIRRILTVRTCRM